MSHLEAPFKLEVSWQQQQQKTRLKTKPAEGHTQVILNQMLNQMNQEEEEEDCPLKPPMQRQFINP